MSSYCFILIATLCVAATALKDVKIASRFKVNLDKKQEVQFLQHRLNKYFDHISNSRKLLSEITHSGTSHDQERLIEMLDQSMSWTSKEKTFFKEHGIDLDLELKSPESPKLEPAEWKRISDIFESVHGNMNRRTSEMQGEEMLKTQDKLLENFLLEHSRMFETQRNPNQHLSQELMYLFTVKKALHGKIMESLLD